MRHLFKLDNQEHAVWLTWRDGRYFLLIGDSEQPVALEGAGGRDRLTVGNVTVPVLAAVDGDDIHIHVDGITRTLRYLDPIRHYAAHSGASVDDVILAPMPGTVVQAIVSPGQAVARGDTLVVIESMKLETAIKSPRDGVVETVHVSTGMTFDRSAPLVTLAPATGA